MSKVIRFDMVFDSTDMPDFGSIEPGADGVLTLLAADVSKLNSALTRTVCTPKLAGGSSFSVSGGTNAIVADEPAVWRYHAGTDTWYEVIANED